ncbi:aldo/keto reductase, partial [Patescibacteria group bacterium]|nr:aldo/keto reductase [Patescibacteria group bacterium]
REHDKLNNDEADITAIKTAIDSGIIHIDTAELYANGYTETLVNKAIRSYDRGKLFIVSKVQPEHFHYDDIINSCQKSIERLGVIYLDLYLLHWYNEDISLKESIEALDELVKRGLVKHIGVSNFTKEHLAEAQEYSENKIVCNQVHYNLIFREPERTGLLEYCQENDVFLTAWRPVEKGALSESVPIIQEMCDKYQKTPVQIAINWLISQKNVLTLSKTRHKEHFQENLGSISWTMESTDIERLRNEYPNQQDISDSVPLG